MMSKHAFLVAFLITALATTALAQDRPVTFIHGLNSDPGTWEVAASRLSGTLAIEPFRPGLAWTQPYADQADQLQGQLGWLPASTIAVGHSNGGVVAREWSRRRPLTGVITLSTPNWGAPLVNHIGDWVNFNFMVYDLVGGIVSAYGSNADVLAWAYPTLSAVTAFANGLSVDAVVTAGSALGIHGYAPVLPNMAAGSGYLADLNGAANLQREAAAIPGRVGIVNIAADYYRGGVIRAVKPEWADAASAYMHTAAALLDSTAMAIVANGGSFSTAQSLLSLSWWLVVHEEIWCRVISDPAPPSYGRCVPNDSVVPVTSQGYPGAANVEFRDTAVHIKQTEGGADAAIAMVLRNVFGVAGRGTPSSPPVTPGGADTLYPGERLWPGQSRVSSDGRVRLTYQGDGNLVLTRDGVPIWASMTVGAPGYAEMQGDGNFVMYRSDGGAPWATNTDGYGGAVLTVSNDGSFSIYLPGGQLLWRASQGS